MSVFDDISRTSLGTTITQNQQNVINLALIKCSNCEESFDSNQQIINAKGEAFHAHCFV